jgi:hypothetical protein
LVLAHCCRGARRPHPRRRPGGPGPLLCHLPRSVPFSRRGFEEGQEALLAIYPGPVRYRIRVRTANLSKRSFEKEARRTKVVPRLRDKKAVLKLALLKLTFAKMIRAVGVGAESRSTTQSATGSQCFAPSQGSTHHHRANITARRQRTPTDGLPPEVHGRPVIYKKVLT